MSKPVGATSPPVTVQPQQQSRIFRTEVFDAPDAPDTEWERPLSNKTLQEQAAGRAATSFLRPPRDPDEQPEKETP
jgi:hypothetical protein